MTTSVSSEPVLGVLLSEREKMLLLLALGMCMFLSSLDGSILATAVATITSDLGGFKLFPWVLTLYMLTSTVVVPIVGKLSDMFGRRPFVISGVLIFLIGSLGAGLAPSMLTLIAARGIQGIGGGFILACVLVVMADMYTPRERAKYVGYILAIITAGTVLGPPVGGFLADGPGWRWGFLINIPIGAIALATIWATLPNTRQGGRISDIDFTGAAILTTATVAGLLVAGWAYQALGWGSAITVGLLVAASVLVVLFVALERRHPNPIIPMSLFRNRMYVITGVVAVLSSAVLFSVPIYLPTFIQTALGASASVAGFLSVPQAIGLVVMSFIGGRIVARTGRFKQLVVLGCALSGLAAFLLQTMGVGDPLWHAALYMVIFGMGSGLVTPLINVIVQASVSQEETGVATSSQMYFRQIAGVIGVAVFGVLFTTTYSSSFTENLDEDVQEVMSVAVFEELRDDATISIEEERMEDVRTRFLEEGGSESLFERALGAQQVAAAAGNQRLFFISAIGGLILVIASLALTEIPLRGRSPAPDEEGEEQPATASASR
ncbi:MAG: MDR family MFS transporter [Chloroflexota bacterium]|nr:MDR family MFS transporter [Chloroflexota bacterium]